MAISSHARLEVIAAVALVSLLAPLALSSWVPDLAGWQSGHGHVSTAVVHDHDHPYDEHDHQSGEDPETHQNPAASVVFTFADDGPLGTALHPPAPSIMRLAGAGRPAEPRYVLHEHTAPTANVPVPPPRA